MKTILFFLAMIVPFIAQASDRHRDYQVVVQETDNMKPLPYVLGGMALTCAGISVYHGLKNKNWKWCWQFGDEKKTLDLSGNKPNG